MLASQAFIEPKKMSLLELYKQMNFIEDKNVRNSQYSIAFWSRLLEPLAYISLAYYAIAILLGPLRQTSTGSRISVGIFSGLGFMYLKNLFTPMVSVFGLPAIIAVLLPIAAVYFVSNELIRRNA
jgi:lipopolysaccharide export system permease protein